MPDVCRPAASVTEAGLTQPDGEVAKPPTDQPLRPLLLGPTTTTRKTRVASTGERLAAAFGQPALAPVLLVGELLGLAADRPT